MDPVALLVALYDSAPAHRLYDEIVTEREHALQCAALAARADSPPALVAAALLHDVGHLILDDNVALTDELTVDHHHDRAGARHLARWFPASVSEPVALHVAAKRYLCATEAGYVDSLSAASLRSLDVQGGPMSVGECAAFARRPGHADAVSIRRWDDTAKVSGIEVPDFDHYRALLQRLVAPTLET